MMLAIDEPERAKFLEHNTACTLKQNPKLEPLLDRLLEIDGDFAVLPVIEDDLDKLLTRGKVFANEVRMKPMQACHCHQNAAALYGKNRRRYRVATGYGLSEDGVWRQHSWAYDTYERTVVETTEQRTVYFGFVMDKAESDQFVADNW